MAGISFVAALIYLAHSCANESIDRSPDDGVKERLLKESKRMFYGNTITHGIVEIETYSGNNGNGNNENGNGNNSDLACIIHTTQ